MKKTVLFIWIHNSARSQMAEAFLNHRCDDSFVAKSAGIEPGKLNPIVVEAMHEIGFDISGNQTKSVNSFLQSGESFDYVITVCDEASAERCPVFPGSETHLHWGFPDPSSFRGTHEECLQQTRLVRDLINARVEAWCKEICPSVAGSGSDSQENFFHRMADLG